MSSRLETMMGMMSPPGPETVIDGKRYLYFGGTSYFGLHSHPAVVRAGIRAFQKYGTHSATSRAGFGNNPVLVQLEEKLRLFLGQPGALTFPSGYLSILALVQSLCHQFQAIFIDEGSHFCVWDAAASSGKPVFPFRHRDPDSLLQTIRKSLKPGERPLLLTDGVFPTYGHISPLPEYAKILSGYDGLIGLDDAHGVGVLGAKGRGTMEYFSLSGQNCWIAGTLSKAFGGHGGFFVGRRKFIQSARALIGTFIGSTPIPTPLAAASSKGIDILRRHPEMRTKLARNVALAKAGMRRLGIPTEDTPVPIIAWSLDSEKKMSRLQKELMGRGIAIAFLKYAGAPSRGVLRITIFATHTTAHIERLLSELSQLI